MNNKQELVHERIKNALIVSCQALEDEPLHSPFIMGRMAVAAKEGGAKGIRANGLEDIREIKQHVDLPIIGIIKEVYENSDVFITPTKREIKLLYNEGVDIIALDATRRPRPDGKTITEVFPEIRKEYPDQLFMADCSTYEEAITAESLGFDYIGTTLNGYTSYTKHASLPNIALLEEIIKKVSKPVIAEGGIWTPEQLEKIFSLGVHAAVVGTAITRPQEITKRFVRVIKQDSE